MGQEYGLEWNMIEEERGCPIMRLEIYSKIDLRAGYHQLDLHPDSRYITTFATHCELYRYTRLIFGVNTAAEIFQYTIQSLLADIAGVRKLQNVNINLKYYNAETIPLLGQTNVSVSYNGNVFNLPLLVVKGNKPSLLGRDWLNVIKLDWKMFSLCTILLTVRTTRPRAQLIL